MDTKRRARRSSILKTRNDGGSGDLNLENMGKDSTLSGNLTGFLPKRRVSFCHTNQVKEFENTNSSTEGSLSKTSDFNQTMCVDMNMSVSMLDESNAGHQDYDKTRYGENDMSFDGESSAKRKSTRLSSRRTSEQGLLKTISTEVNDMPLKRTDLPNTTSAADMNMSVTMLDATRAVHQDYDKTRWGENDMSFDGESGAQPLSQSEACIKPSMCKENPLVTVTDKEILKPRNDGGSGDLNLENVRKDNTLSGNLTGFLPKRRVSFCHTNQVKEFENTNSSTKGALSKTTDFNQTMCADMNMSVSMLDATKAVHLDYDQTRCGENDMSFDGESIVTRKSICRTSRRASEQRLLKTISTGVNGMPLECANVPNTTIAADMNMSVTMLDATKAVHQDYDKTRFGEKDMSFEGESSAKRKSTRLSSRRASEQDLLETLCNDVNDMPLKCTDVPNTTSAADMNMSITMLDATKAVHQDYDKTRFGDNDMSFDGESPVTRKSTRPSSQRASEQGLLKTLFNTANDMPFKCTDVANTGRAENINMSLTMLDTTKAVHQDYDKTRWGDKDMSFDGESPVTRKSTRQSSRRASEHGLLKTFSTEVNDMSLECTDVPNTTGAAQPLSQSEACFKPSECKVNPTVTVTDNEARQYHETLRSNPMVFNQPNPENFSNPFGNGTKRSSKLKEPQNKLSFGKFGSSKTPKRNKIVSIVPPKPQQHQNVKVVKMTNDANVQTSPMVQAPPLKKNTQEVGFNCTLGAIDTRKFSDASLMTSPAYFSAPKAQQTNPEERELPKMESVCVGTSVIMTPPANFSAPKGQQTNPKERELPKKESVCLGTSVIMTPPANFSAPKAQQTNPEERELPKKESVCVSTSMIMSSPANLPAPKSQQIIPPTKSESSKMGTFIVIASPTAPPPLNQDSAELEVSVASNSNASLPLPAGSILENKSSSSQSTSPQQISETVELFKEGSLALGVGPDKPTDLSEENVASDDLIDKASYEDVPQEKSEEKMVVDEDEVEDKDHSFENRKGNRTSQDMKQTETLRSIGVDNSQYNMSFDQSSVRRQSEKTQNGIVEESYFFETTLPVHPTMCAAPVSVPVPPQIPGRSSVINQINHNIPKASEDEVSFAAKPASTPGFEELLEKLNECANTSDLDIFAKWGFLRYAMNKLAKIAEHEWQEVLNDEKNKEFLGQDYIKAVNTHRSRLISKEPLYVGAMKYAAEMKKKGIPLA